jgi:predicted transcriptional regulator
LSGRGKFSGSRANESDRQPQEKVDGALSSARLVNMDVPLNPDLQAKRSLDYEAWFLREVDLGLAAANRGEFADHADVRKMIDERYPG